MTLPLLETPQEKHAEDRRLLGAFASFHQDAPVLRSDRAAPACALDSATGYRYYSARQLSQLHRILALKDFGFTLEQIAQALDEGITAEQMRGMLLLRQAQ